MRLPAVVESFLRAIQNADGASLCATLGSDGVLIENDRTYRRSDLQAWLDRMAARGAHAVVPIQKLTRKGQVVVATICRERRDPHGEGTESRTQWTFALSGDLVSRVAVEPDPAPVLPPVVGAYVRATNHGDLDALMATFHPNALVNDQLQEHPGYDSIREWAARDVIGVRLTMYVVEAVERHGTVVVTANVDGEFNKRGLPDPLVLAFYFSIGNGRIVQLIILRNLPNA